MWEMDYEDAIVEAAQRADRAVARAIRSYRDQKVTDEDDLTGVLVGNLQAELHGVIGGLSWSVSVQRHSKSAAIEEERLGADMLIYVEFETTKLEYSKGVLVRAKRVEARRRAFARREHEEFQAQCRRMLLHTPASYVFVCSRKQMRCGSALLVSGASNRLVYDQCVWSSYRFFRELFDVKLEMKESQVHLLTSCTSQHW